MDDYINNLHKFNKIIIYNFKLGDGGIGDYIKFFMICLTYCMDNNIACYQKINNIKIEKYIKLKYDFLYITEDEILKLKTDFEIKTPVDYYKTTHFNYNVNINEVFYFEDIVKMNVKNILTSSITDYISIHLRLGDKDIDCDMREKYVLCKDDTRNFSRDNIYKFIENNYKKNIMFFCDNNEYKLKIKKKYPNIILTNSQIGHISFSNTTHKQVLDTVTDFYLLTNSELIYAASYSGFSVVASKFKNIKLVT